jgi:hypothetical protein
MRLENLHHFSNFTDAFWFNVVWHRQSVATWIICMRLAESHVTVMSLDVYGLSMPMIYCMAHSFSFSSIGFSWPK